MKCEQVEELLSAYLDGTLALGEAANLAGLVQYDIANHLQECERCSTALADYCRFDLLLAQLPRVSPDPALREKLFSSPEYLELTGTYGASGVADAQTVPYRVMRYNKPGRPPLVALPGGRSSSSTAPTTPRVPTPRSTQQLTKPVPSKNRPEHRPRRGRASWGLRVMRVAIAAVVLLTLGVGSVIGWNIWQEHAAPPQVNSAITPPAGLPESVPLSEGMHYVFLRDGALWSASVGGSASARQLTPGDVLVAEGWVVSPSLPGRYAGDMLAYIDLQQARVHTIRSDGLSDSVVPQPLLSPGTVPTSVWDTAAGMTILNSLTWSKDSTMLAFVADPQGTGSTGLYIYSTQTNSVQRVSLPVQGSVSQPVWSPDGTRIAFVLVHHGIESIVDYNIQNHGVLIINSRAPSPAYPGDTVLSLAWSPGIPVPTITWSVGVIGHIHGIWQQHVGAGWTPTPQAMLAGDYVQAIYSPVGHGGAGSWLLVTSIAGRAANLLRLDLTPGAFPAQLTQGRQVNIAQWSPDGRYVDYLDSVSAGVGALHVVDVASARDTRVATGVADDPAPAWSADGQQLAYSTGTRTVIVTAAANAHSTYALPLHGHAEAFSWFADDSGQLVLVLSDGQQGVYLVDARHHVLHQVDQPQMDGPIVWTEVP